MTGARTARKGQLVSGEDPDIVMKGALRIEWYYEGKEILFSWR
jgi:hypothetical protein